jgi:hypothetical protein
LWAANPNNRLKKSCNRQQWKTLFPRALEEEEEDINNKRRRIDRPNRDAHVMNWQGEKTGLTEGKIFNIVAGRDISF